MQLTYKHMQGLFFFQCWVDSQHAPSRMTNFQVYHADNTNRDNLLYTWDNLLSYYKEILGFTIKPIDNICCVAQSLMSTCKVSHFSDVGFTLNTFKVEKIPLNSNAK